MSPWSKFSSSSKHFKLSSEHSPAFLQQLKDVGCQKSVHHSSKEGSRRLSCIQGMVTSLCWLNTLHLHAKDDINLFCHRIYGVLATNVPMGLPQESQTPDA